MAQLVWKGEGRGRNHESVSHCSACGRSAQRLCHLLQPRSYPHSELCAELRLLEPRVLESWIHLLISEYSPQSAMNSVTVSLPYHAGS